MAENRKSRESPPDDATRDQDGAAPYVPDRKRPWLLALAAVLVAGWMVFLAVMAARG